MIPRNRPLRVCILAVALLVGSRAGPLWAQDRGAPRFGSTTPTDTIAAEATDAGRLWSVATPPFDRFERRYGVDADSAWATHLRRGILRLPDCTGALVSGEGLALTTARCIRRHLETANREEAVVATSPSQERRVPDLHADRLLAATDVTADVRAAKAEQGGSLQQAMQAVEERLQAEAPDAHRVEVVSAAGGARHTAYTYRRYDDVRLAFLPERALSDFGDIETALTYPRSVLDVAILRVYAPDGTPLAPEHFFETATQEIRPGDPVFAVGHSVDTRRAETADQLAFRRDVVLPSQQGSLETWTDAAQAYLDTAHTAPSGWGEGLDEGQRALKRTRARLKALQNDYFMTRLQKRDARLRRALQGDPALAQRFGGLLDSLASLQGAKRDLSVAYRAFAPLEAGPYRSSTLRRALLAHHASEVKGASTVVGDSLWQQVSEVAVQPAPVDAALLATHLERLRTFLRPDTTAVRQLLGGATPAERAASVVNTSVLSGPDPLRDLRAEGSPRLPEEDPALALVEAFASRYRSFRQEWGTLKRSERQLTRRLARARSEISSVLAGGEGAPRLTDGRLLGYPYNGTTAPPFTTLFGLYSQSRAFDGEGAWALPERWWPAPTELDRSVPLTLAVSTDGAAGTSGAPLLNRYLEIVGVTVGSNIQGVAGTYLFLPERMRTVGVDLRGLRQALTTVYEAGALADELFEGTTGSGEASR